MILDLFRKEIGFNNIEGYDDIKDVIVVFTQIGNNFGYLHGLHFSAW
jgi:hypothetical protein